MPLSLVSRARFGSRPGRPSKLDSVVSNATIGLNTAVSRKASTVPPAFSVYPASSRVKLFSPSFRYS